MIYLDNAATSVASEKVTDIVIKTMKEDYGNPSSKHILGVDAEKYVKTAAAQIAATLKVKDKEIIFTSGGTESNNMALIGTAFANRRAGKHIITTAIEHPSVYQPLEFLEEMGYEITALPVDHFGHINLDELKAALREDTILVSTMMTNNEVGAIEPVEDISAIIKEFNKSHNKNIYYHVDAIQAYGKLRIYPKRMGIDMLSVSAHKIHGPKGVGFLYVDEKVKINPIIFGGGQQKGMRSGTMNVPGIAGLGVAAEEAYTDFDNRIAAISAVKDYIIENASLIEGVTVNTPAGNASAPHIVSISVEDVKSEVLLHALEADGICVSSGSACSAHHPGISGTLKGIGVADKLLDSTIRISLCESNTIEEADQFISALKKESEILKRFTHR